MMVDGSEPMLVIVMWLSMLFQQATAADNDQAALQVETLLQTSSSWDGEPYKPYLTGQPELSILKIIIPPHRKLEWHSHPIPSAAYIVAGELTLERKKDGKKQQFTAGQSFSETIDTLHRGLTGDEPVVLTVFYAGISDTPLTEHPAPLNRLP